MQYPIIVSYNVEQISEGSALDILFPSNHNIHKSSYGHCYWVSDPLIERF